MKLIDKAILVAEIERRIKERNFQMKSRCWFCSTNIYEDLLDFLDTLETKEVDLEKEYKDFVEEDPVYNKLVNGIVGKAIAKHFFELGIELSNKAEKEEEV